MAEYESIIFFVGSLDGKALLIRKGCQRFKYRTTKYGRETYHRQRLVVPAWKTEYECFVEENTRRTYPESMFQAILAFFTDARLMQHTLIQLIRE